MAKFYAIRKGKKVGIFNTWAECESYIKGYSGAEYKSFKTLEEAETYINPVENEIDFSDDYIEAYVDGSYENSIKQYGSGIVLIKDNKVILEECFMGEEEDLVSMRNVAGEIKASEFAMKYCLENNHKNLIIYYDYLGVEYWCTGAWKAGKEGTIAYKKAYDNYTGKGLNVKFIKVKAHSGNHYNDLADKLAKKAIGL